MQRARGVVVAGPPHDTRPRRGKGRARSGPIRYRAQPVDATRQGDEKAPHYRTGALGAAFARSVRCRQRPKPASAGPAGRATRIRPDGRRPAPPSPTRFGRQPPRLHADCRGPRPGPTAGGPNRGRNPEIRRRGRPRRAPPPTSAETPEHGTVNASVGVSASIGVRRRDRDTAGVEERGELPSSLGPRSKSPRSAMQWPLLGRAVVATHPEGAGLHQHDAVGQRRQPRGQRQHGGGHERDPACHSAVCNTGPREYTPTPGRLTG